MEPSRSKRTAAGPDGISNEMLASATAWPAAWGAPILPCALENNLHVARLPKTGAKYLGIYVGRGEDHDCTALAHPKFQERGNQMCMCGISSVFVCDSSVWLGPNCTLYLAVLLLYIHSTTSESVCRTKRVSQLVP
eukprot:5763360-Amphidinium_carterae.1